MARIRNPKQGSSTKPSRRKESAAKAKPADHSSDEENLVTEAHETNDPTLAADVSVFLKDLHSGPSKKKRDGKAKGDVALLPTEKSKPKEKRSSDKGAKSLKKASKEIEKDADVPLSGPIQPRSSTKFIFPPTSQWDSVIPPLPAVTNFPTPTPTQTSSLLSKATSLHATDVQNYTASGVSTGSASDNQFLQKVLQSGTLSDRLSAMTLLVQGSPVHNVKSLESLKSMAERGKGKGGREESLKALRCIVDWWVGGGAPDRKLKYFLDQPLLHPRVTDQHLLAWYFEDWLKKYFFSVLQILENLLHDPLPYVRTQTIGLVFALLRDKPEQEQNLLRLLVNKLGDLEKSISSRVSHHLLQLLQAHPSMKGIVVREIVSLILKPRASTAAASSILPSEPAPPRKNTKIVFSDAPSTSMSKPPPKSSKEDKKTVGTSHARYYAAITFNQIVLSPSQADRDVARELVNIYFELFKDILGQDGTDFNDATEDVSRVKESKGDSSKGKSKKQRGKEVKGDAGFTELEDSNSKLISAVLTGVNRALPFAKLDADDPRFKKHLDTLFLITHKSTFNITLQALLLIHQISTTASSTSSSSSGSITDRFYRTLYASLYDPRLSTSSKQAMYLNLLFKCIKSDENLERAKAFVRRFIQILASGGGGGAEFTAGGLHLLGELFSTVPGLRDMLRAPAKRKPASNPTEDEGEDEEQLYDPRKREPEFAHASNSPLWELLPLLSHYHPTVSLHARQLLSSQPLTSTPDLALNTLSHFLDRFVYKNPKKQSSKQKGSSAMQPAAGDAIGGGGVRLIKGEVDGSLGPSLTVNDEKWWKRRVEDVPIDQVFFHKYFNRKNELEKARATKAKKKKKGKGDEEDSDAESDEDGDEEKGEEDEGAGDDSEKSSEDEEAEIWTAMKASMPKELDISDEEDSITSGLDEDGDGDSLADLQDSEDPVDDEEEPSEVVDDDDDDKLSLVESSDAEDLIPLDEAEALAFRDGLIDWPGGGDDSSGGENEEDEEWTGFGGGSPALGDKRRRKGGKEEQKKRKKVRSLPTFASYEDYAKLIEEGPEDDI